MASEDLSAYELERAQNIKRNQQVLESLGLGGSLIPVPTAVKPPPRPKRPPPPPRQPTRKSARVASLPAPDMYVAEESARGQITVGGNATKALKEEASAGRQSLDPISIFGDGSMPENEEELLEGERPAFDALRTARRAVRARARVRVREPRLGCCSGRPSVGCALGVQGVRSYGAAQHGS